MFNEEQIKDLNCWRRISKNILDLYSQLNREELLNGKDTEQYKKLQGYLELCLECESEIESEFAVDDELYNNALKYLDDSSQGFLRILTRHVRSIDMAKTNYDSQIEKIDYCLANVTDEAMRVRLLRLRQSSLVNCLLTIFYNLYDKSLLDLIESELQSETDRTRRDLLIFNKNSILSGNKSLENGYLGFDDIDLFLLNDVEAITLLFNISITEYNKCMKTIMINAINQKVTKYLNSEEEFDSDEFQAIDRTLRALLNMLDVDFIKQLLEDFEKSYELCCLVPDKKYYSIRNSYLRAINENSIGSSEKLNK